MELLDNLQRTPSQQDGIRSRFLLMADFLLESKQSIFGHLKTAARFPFATRLRKIFSLSFISLASLLLLLFIVISAIVLYPKAIEAKEAWSKVGVAIETKDLESIQSTLGDLDFAVSDLERSFGYLTYLKFIPFVNLYYQDGFHLLSSLRLGLNSGLSVTNALIPHEEILGLKSGFGDQITVEQRLQNLLGTLPSLSKKLDLVWTNIGLIKKELSEIDPFRYPEDFQGVRVRFWLEEAQKILEETEPLFSRGKEILEISPSLFGSPPRTYLVLFQNAAELRTTGGFITGFYLLSVKDGQILSNDFHSGAYFADNYPPELGVPPPPLGKYLSVGKWHFQDSNFSPDFPTTAQTILKVWEKSSLPKVDGVVAINTHIASDLLTVTGPLRLVGYDSDLSKTNLPDDCRQGGRDFTSVNLVCRLEYYVEKAPNVSLDTETRKVILDNISNAVIDKVSSSSAEIWPTLIDFVFKHLSQKKLMVYLPNKKEQSLISNLGYGGEIKDLEGDYLHINDSNFGGLKTNLYVQEEVEQELSKLEDGIWRKTVKIKYYNPVPYDGWLSGNYKDFVRIYVPKDSKLVSIDGALQIWTSPDLWSEEIQNGFGWAEFDKTVYGAYFTVLPQEEHILTFVYDLPISIIGEEEYKLLMQKQSATNIGLVRVKIDDKMETFDLKTDRKIT